MKKKKFMEKKMIKKNMRNKVDEKAIEFIENTIKGFIVAMQNKKKKLKKEDYRFIEALIRMMEVLRIAGKKNEK